MNAPDRPPLALQFEVPEVDVQRGYAAWSTTYDTAPNPLISLEESAVRTLISALLGVPGALVWLLRRRER